MPGMLVSVHPTAEVSPEAWIGVGASIGHMAHIQESAWVGDYSTIGNGACVGTSVRVGSYVTIQSFTHVCEGVTIEDGVFVGPHVCFGNDLFARSVTVDGRPKNRDDWMLTPTVIQYGASIGAGAVIQPGVTVGRFAVVLGGSVVTRDVAPHALVTGNPAGHRGFVCRCAHLLARVRKQGDVLVGYCEHCGDDCEIGE